MADGEVRVRAAAPERHLWWLVVAAALAAWAMLAWSDGVASAAPDAPTIAGHSAAHQHTKPPPRQHRQAPGVLATHTRGSISPTRATAGAVPSQKASNPSRLTPGYLVNSTINTIGGAPAGTADHPSPVLARNVPQLTQLSRQLVGIGFDGATMAASLVNNVATLAAHQIGPHALWGLPFRALTAVAVISGNISKTLTGTPLNAVSTGPFAVNYGVYDMLRYFNPSGSPPGANDPSITVTADHPLPVILLAGTGSNQNFGWSVGAPVLANAGYKVYTLNYGNVTGNPHFPLQGTGDIARSAQQLSDEIDKVLAQTGAPKVILIGHSQGGGVLPLYYINKLDGAAKVSQVIGIAPSNHGTDVDGLAGLLSIPVVGEFLKALVNIAGAGLVQQTTGSSWINQVYADGDTRPGVIYDTITTVNDEVVTPYTRQALNGQNVTNVILQQQDPGYAGGHGNVVVSYRVWQDVLGMLAENPAAAPVPSPAAA